MNTPFTKGSQVVVGGLPGNHSLLGEVVVPPSTRNANQVGVRCEDNLYRYVAEKDLAHPDELVQAVQAAATAYTKSHRPPAAGGKDRKEYAGEVARAAIQAVPPAVRYWQEYKQSIGPIMAAKQSGQPAVDLLPPVLLGQRLQLAIARAIRAGRRYWQELDLEEIAGTDPGQDSAQVQPASPAGPSRPGNRTEQARQLLRTLPAGNLVPRDNLAAHLSGLETVDFVHARADLKKEGYSFELDRESNWWLVQPPAEPEPEPPDKLAELKGWLLGQDKEELVETLLKALGDQPQIAKAQARGE